MDLMLKGKIALVTASSQGLGYAAARALAQEGANIVLCARRAAPLNAAAVRLAAETGVEVLPVVADVSSENDIEVLVTQTLKRFKRVDALFLNAGGPPTGHFMSLTPRDWEEAIQLTIQGVVHLMYAVAPVMQRQGGGSILANTSVTVRHPLDNLILSNSLRLAVVGLVKSLSIEMGPDNVRVNAIAPGWTRTERLEEILRARVEQNGTTPEVEAAAIIGDVPLRRMADPMEFGRAAAFLLSPAASYITGVTLLVDGGMARAML